MTHTRPERITVRFLCLSLVLLTAIAGVSASTDAPKQAQGTCSGVHKVGDRLTCYVTFARKTDFTGLDIVFNLVGERKPGQRGAYINLVLRESKKVGPRTYAVSGPVDDCVPGTYVLVAVSARTAHDWQEYLMANDGVEKLSIIVENDSGTIQIPEATKNAPEAPRPVATPAPPPPRNPVQEVVDGPAPDASVFPGVQEVSPAPASAEPVHDLVSLIRRIFRKPDACGGTHGQGEMLSCRITFAGNSRFHTVGLGFYRIGEPKDPSQKQLYVGFSIATHQGAPGADGAYEITGAVPKCGPGKYRVNSITAFSESGKDSSKLYAKNYFNGIDFKSNIILKVKDTASRTFPPIVSVSATAPR